MGYNHEDLFYHEYFAKLGHDYGRDLAKELWRELQDTGSGRTLFVLDGLDEVSHNLDRDDDMSRFLVELLSQPNVIITSRPNASLPDNVQDLDLELETVGFYPDQVKAYLKADPKTKQHANEVQSFLQDHWLMQGLVRIPIQLDALCYTWDDFDSDTAPDTMTCIYKAIELKLWKKDIVRLDRLSESHAKSARPAEIMGGIATEIELLECLAFNGLYSDVMDFTPTHRDDIVERFSLRLPLDDMLTRLSFLRTSDPLSGPEHRNYHFIHLTFQEYFAAQYFVRKWKDHKQLEYVFNRQQNSHSNPLINPVRFLQRHKYSVHYDVFWRFVAGMLDAEWVHYFFNAIEEEPLDLLGPAHQRLVMHCLSEVPRDIELPRRKDLERGLSEWLLFEYELRGSVHLAREMEFPEQALDAAFREGSDEMKKEILEAVSGRAAIPSSILEVGASWLGNKNWEVQRAAVKVLCSRSALPEEILKIVAARLGDEDETGRRVAIAVLDRRSALPDEILKTMAARLGDEDREVQQAAVRFLCGRSALPEEILKTMVTRLGDENWEVRWAAVEALGSRSALPDEILRAIATRQGDEDREVRQAAVRVLCGRSALPEEILKTMATRLGDKDREVRQAAIEALGSRSALPDEILRAIATRLGNEEWDVRRAAEVTLRQQRDFYHNLLNGPHVMSLYGILLRLSFDQQLVWYIEDGDSCVNMPNDIRRISISDHDNYVETIVNARPANYPSICSK